MTPPTIRRWLTPAGFAAAVPQLAPYPLPAVSHALARLATTAVAVLDTGTGSTAVYVVAPSHALLVDVAGEAHGNGSRHVHLPPPLSGSAAASMPVPVVVLDTLLAALAETGRARPWPDGDTPYPAGWANRAVTTLAQEAGTARQALGTHCETEPADGGPDAADHDFRSTPPATACGTSQT